MNRPPSGARLLTGDAARASPALVLTAILLIAGCGGGGGSSRVAVTSNRLASGTADGAGAVVVEVTAGDATGARLTAPAGALAPGSAVELRLSSSLAGGGLTSAGPAIEVVFSRGVGLRPPELTLVFGSGGVPTSPAVIAATAGGERVLFPTPQARLDAGSLSVAVQSSGTFEPVSQATPVFAGARPVALPSGAGASLSVTGSGYTRTDEVRLGALLTSANVQGSGFGITGLTSGAGVGAALELDYGAGFLAIKDVVTVYETSRPVTAPSAVTPMRSSAACVTLLDGRVLVCGGQDEQRVALADCYLFDPETNAVTPADSLAAGRFSHAAVLLDDGDVAVLGGMDRDAAGQSTAHTSIEVFDPATGVWTTRGLTLLPRSVRPGALRLPNGDWMLLGGFVDTAFTANQPAIEILGPAMTTRAVSAATTSLTTPIGLASGDAVLIGDAVGFASTNQVEVLTLAANPAALTSLTDPVASVAIASGALTHSYSTPSACRFPEDDRILVMDRSSTAQRVDLLQVTTGPQPTATALDADSILPAARRRNGLVILPRADGTLFVGPGGQSSNDTTPFADIYQPGPVGQLGAFLPITVGERRSYVGCTLRDGRVALISGRSGSLSGGPLLDTIELVGIEALAIAGAGPAQVIASATPYAGLTIDAARTRFRLVANGPLDPRTIEASSLLVELDTGSGFTTIAPAAVSPEADRRVVRVDLPTGTLQSGDRLRITVQAGVRDAFGRPLELSAGAPTAAWRVR